MTLPIIGDPTSRTLESIHREVKTLGDDMANQFESERRVVAEKLSAVELQFALVERMRVEQKKDTKDAVDAALTAQKEAVKEQTTAFGLATTKSETAVAEQLKQLTVTFTTAISGVTDTIDGVKERVGKVEGVRQGGNEAKAAMWALGGLVVGAIPSVIALIVATR